MYNDYHNNCKKNETVPCTKSIREALKVIKDCVSEHSNMPGFGVELIITLNSGTRYNVGIHSGVLNQFKICETIVYFGDLAVSLCDISRIKVLTHKTCNYEFKSNLKRRLFILTKKHSNCTEDYLAIGKDDDCRYYYKKQNCNCSKCNPSNCNNKEEEYKCSMDIQNNLKCNKERIESIGFNGSNSEREINSIEDIEKTQVVQEVDLITHQTSVIKDVNLQTNTSSVIGGISLSPKTIVSDVNVTNTNVVNSVSSSQISVLSDVVLESTEVVNNVSTSIVPVLQSVSVQKQAVTIPVATSSKNVVTDITVVTNTCAKTVTPQTTSVLESVTTGVTPVVTSLGSATTQAVVTEYNSPVTTNAITGLGTPTTQSVLGGITSATSVGTSTVPVASFTQVVAGGLFITIQAGSLRPNPPIPAQTITIPLTFVDGTPVVVSGVTNVISLNTPGNFLSVQGNPQSTNVVTGYPSPQSGAFVTSLGSPVTTNAVTGYNSPVTTNVVNSVTQTPATVVSGIDVVSGSCKCVDSVIKEAVQVASSSTELNLVTDITSTPVNINNVNQAGTVSINTVSSKIPTNVISNVSTQNATIANVSNVSKDSINNISNISNANVLSAASLTKGTTNVLSSASLREEKTCVVKDIDVICVEVLSPNDEEIHGQIIGVGCGLLIAEDCDDIEIYSICEINSFTTK